MEVAIYLSRLTLTNFRNYRSLELELSPGIALLQGDNAQGKSNLLEAIYLLATTRSPRASAEVELIHWEAMAHPMPLARLEAQVRRGEDTFRATLMLRGQRLAPGEALAVEKRLQVNGVAKRAQDFVGLIQAVWFSSQDIDLLAGPPALRRRYLDILNSLIDRRYLHALQRYQRILGQRTHLLRMIRESQAGEGGLEVWDQGLVEVGCYLLQQRSQALAELAPLAQEGHRRLAGEGDLSLDYRPSPQAGPGAAQAFQGQLHSLREREVQMGMTLVGPHRDDLRLLLRGHDMGLYGSRGERRTIALCLRLAEAELMRRRTGEEPILLLDDAFSELDPGRRHHLQDWVQGRGQTLITATDLHPFPPAFLAAAARFRVRQGQVEPL